MFRINLQRFVTINTKNNGFLSSYHTLVYINSLQRLNKKKKNIFTKERNRSNDNLNRRRNPRAKSIHHPPLHRNTTNSPTSPKDRQLPGRPITLSTISSRSISLLVIIPSLRTAQCISNSSKQTYTLYFYIPLLP